MSQPEDVIIRRVGPDDGVSKKGSSSKKGSAGKKSKSKETDSSASKFVRQYERHIRIIALVLALFSILVLLALISYTPKDEINTDVTFRELVGLFSGNEIIKAKVDTTGNWLSIVGAMLADRLINHSFGYSIIVLPFLLILWAIKLFKNFAPDTTLIRRTLVTLIFCFLFSSLMGTFSRISWMPNISKEWSGSLGQFSASVISGFIGTAGSFLLLMTFVVLTFILGTHINFKELYLKGLSVLKKVDEKLKISEAISKRRSAAAEKTVLSPASEIIEPVSPLTEEPARIFKSNINVSPNNSARPADIGFVPNFKDEVIEKPVPIINSFLNNGDKDPAQRPKVEPEIIKPSAASDNNALVDSLTAGKNVEGNDISDTTDSGLSIPPEIEEQIIEEFEVIDNNYRNTDIPVNFDENTGEIFDKPFDNIPNALDSGASSASKKPLVVTVFDNKPEEPSPVNPLSTGIHDEEINYKSPTIQLLNDDTEDHNYINEEELKQNARILQEKLETFKIYIENLSVTPGPVVTQYEFVPAAGIKISKIESLADDIAMALKAPGIRIIAPIPGKGTVGIEIPNRNPLTVRFSSVLKSSKFHNTSLKLPLALGKTISGDVYCTDLARMPHLLIAGSTGSGKSVGINTIIASLLYKMHPKNLKFVIVDPKKVELKQYEVLENHFLAVSPDLDHAIITDPADAVIVLKAVCAEMDLRYDILASVGQRNITDYNKKVREGKFKDDKEFEHRAMPFIVVIIDELADLMLTASKEVETPIIRLAQLARAVGIHLVVATQRPSVDVITGIIKANFPARIAYLVASRVDSRTILDVSGAEHLLGNGDMLFQAGGTPHPIRIQNSFLSTEEVEALCDFVGSQKGYSKPYMLPSLNEEGGVTKNISPDERDPLFEDAARLIIRHQQGSVSLIQRRLKVGYARAGRIVDELEAAGVVGPFDGSKARVVLMDSESQLEAVL